jgi:hypothetical protein
VHSEIQEQNAKRKHPIVAKKMSTRIVSLLFCVLFFFNACQQDKRDDLPDISKIPRKKLEIRRFEQDLFAIDTNNMAAGLAQLEQKYGEFAAIYFSQILGSKDPQVAPQGHVAYIKGFVSFPAVRKLSDTIQDLYPDFPAKTKEELEEAFRYLKYYFPERKTPQHLTTFLSEYSFGNFIYTGDNLAVGLDFFLGENYSYQKYYPENPNFSAYMTRTFNREHLSVKTLMPLLEDIIGPARGDQMLDVMIHHGKRLYLLDHLLPMVADSAKMEVSQKQWDWMVENERNMWGHFLEQNLLYNNEWQKFRKFVEYSPNSPGMPAEAPGRTGDWVGWQIIKAYMKQFPETSMKELLALPDSQDILKKSRYKPRQ